MDLDFLQRRARGLLASLQERFRELECRDYPSAATIEALKQLRRLLAQVEVKLSSADLEQTKLFIRAAISWQELLIHFDNAHTEQTPRGLVRVLEKLLIAHKIHAKCRLIAAPAAEYNYSISDLAPQILGPIKGLFTKEEEQQEANDFLKFFADPLFVITFPRMERDNILVHSVFGHEVGHLVAARCLSDSTTLRLVKTQMNAIRDSLREKFADKSAAEKTVASAKELNYILAYWQRGMEELLSDYVGLLLFGPSALFAFYYVTSHASPDRLPSGPGFYPPDRHRLRFALQTLEEEGFLDAFGKLVESSPKGRECFPSVLKFVSHLQTLAADDADQKAMQEQPMEAMKKGYGLIESTIQHAKALAKKQVQALTYSRASFEAEIGDLVERISFDIPPNEIGVGKTQRPAAWPSAILAGWCWAIHGQKSVEGQPRPLTAEQRDLLNIITLRAVESILMKQLYDEERSKQ